MNDQTASNKPLLIGLGLLLFVVVLLGAYLSGKDPAPAKVVQARGQVERIDAAGASQALKGGETLAMGDSVETGPDSGATLAFIDDSRLILAENSRITLNDLYKSRMGQRSQTRLLLEAGDAESRVNPHSGFSARYQVVTPALQLAVRGTVFMVKVDKKTGKTHSVVLEGQVQAGREGESTKESQVAILAGYGTVTDVGQPLGSPKELLPAPELVPLQPMIERLPLNLAWKPLQQAQSYRVQLLAGPQHEYLIYDGSLSGAEALIEELPDADYRLKIRGIDELGLEGRNGEHAFTLNAHPFPPELKARKQGKAYPSSKKVKLRWKRSTEAETYRIQVSDQPDFSNLITDVQELPAMLGKLSIKLPAGSYYWRAASWNQAEGYGPFSDVGQFEVMATNGAQDPAGAPEVSSRATP